MKKLLIIILLTLVQSLSVYADDGKAVGYDGALELPEDARPNNATISLFEERKEIFINRRKMQGQLYTIEPKGNAVEFNFDKNLPSSTLEKELSEGFILSYLYYENGVIKYNGKAKNGRFIKDITDDTLFYTHSTGKSIVFIYSWSCNM